MNIRPSILFTGLFTGLFIGTAVLAITAFWLAPLSAEERTWTDSTGKHTIDAELVRSNDGEVTLRRSNGKLITLPLEKLSKEDREFVLRQDQTTGSEKTTPDLATIREASKKFFRALREESKDEIGATLSLQARRRYEASGSPVEKLPSPDPGASIRVGRVSTDGDTATADVSVRLRGKFQKTTLSLRCESDTWRVCAISAKGPDGKLVSFDFEEGGDALADHGSESSDSDNEQFSLPKGGPVELLRFIKKLKEATPPERQNHTEARAYQEKRFAAILKAAEKILEDDDASKQHEMALKHKFDALKSLSRLGVSGLSEKLDRLPDELKAIGLSDLADNARSVALQDKVGRLEGESASKVRALFSRIEKHLQTVSLGDVEASLARTAGQSAQRFLDNKAAGAIHKRLGKLLSEAENRSVAAVGEKMLGVARRLTLLGNEMHVEGVMLDGKPLDWSDYRGKVVLVDFWATWCGPCIQEMPNVKKAFAEYHEKGFDVVGISLDNNREKVEAYVESNEIPWTTLFSDDKEATGWEHPMANYYGISGIPTAILVGPNGKVVSLNCRGKSLGKLLEELLGKAG